MRNDNNNDTNNDNNNNDNDRRGQTAAEGRRDARHAAGALLCDAVPVVRGNRLSNTKYFYNKGFYKLIVSVTLLV